jgi:2-phosphosulfolactate phosphatase
LKSKVKSLEVCFTPNDFESRLITSDFVVVVTDIFRFSTSICAAFAAGIKTIIPVADLNEAKECKQKGFLVAAERDGIKSDFADFGNSPFKLMTADLSGKTLVYSTTNGTRAIEMISHTIDAAVGAFLNLKYAADWVVEKNKNVVVLCAGWNNTPSLEDTLFAGALIESLNNREYPIAFFDSATIAYELWQQAKNDLNRFLTKGSHYQRLKMLNEAEVLDYSTKINMLKVLPVLQNGKLINLLTT